MALPGAVTWNLSAPDYGRIIEGCNIRTATLTFLLVGDIDDVLT